MSLAALMKINTILTINNGQQYIRNTIPALQGPPPFKPPEKDKNNIRERVSI
jgi:hypothetical protein